MISYGSRAASAVVRAPRFPVEMPVRFRSTSESAWHEGQIENVSRSGVFFRCDRVMKVNTGVEMSFILPVELLGAAGAEVECRGFVSRIEHPVGERMETRLAVTISKYRFVREDKKLKD